MKICNGRNCIHKRKPQPLSNFHKNCLNSDGFDYWCKDCKRQWYLDNPEKAKLYALIFKKNNPDYHLKKAKDFYSKNKEFCILRSNKWVKNNPERRREISRNSEKRRYWKKRFIFYTAFINLKIKKYVI